ncbi:MAG: acyltransferase [Opitutales bacterium]
MNLRLLAGTLLSWGYTHVIGSFPVRFVRRAYLKAYLGQFGQGTGVQMRCRFLNGRRVYLGARNVVNFGCTFDGRHYDIRMGSDVSIGPEATILTLGHDPDSPEFANAGGAVSVGDRVWIGYRAIILPGVTIGEGAVVAAGSVVTKDVAPFTVVGGAPARKLRDRSKNLAYTLNFDPPLL